MAAASCRASQPYLAVAVRSTFDKTMSFLSILSLAQLHNNNNSSRNQIQSSKKLRHGEKKHKRRERHSGAGPERRGNHVIKDDMVSAWAPAVRHMVDARWVPRSKEKIRAGNVRRGVNWRCVKSVTVSVVPVSAQLMMEDVSVCRACDSRKCLSHLSYG